MAILTFSIFATLQRYNTAIW